MTIKRRIAMLEATPSVNDNHVRVIVQRLSDPSSVDRDVGKTIVVRFISARAID